jgi:hypothetical protein
MSKYLMAQQKQGINATKGAIDYYNKGASKLQDKAASAEEGLAATNDPNNIGSLGQARSLAIRALGMNRYNEAEAQAVLPPTLYSSISKVFNSAGDENSPMNSAQQQAMNTLFKHSLNSVQQQHDMLRSNAVSEYELHPAADPTKAQQLQQSLGSQFDSHLKQVAQKYSQSAAPATPQSAGQPAQPSALQRLGSYFGMGSQPDAQAQSATGAANTAPMTFEQFKASRKNGGQ